MAAFVIVYVADAVSEPPSLPVATTLYAPADNEGTVNVQEKAPAAEVVCEVHVWVPGVAPLKAKVLMAVLGVKPEPVTVTVTPLSPWVGASTIVGVVIVKVADAVSDPPSLPVAATV